MIDTHGDVSAALSVCFRTVPDEDTGAFLRVLEEGGAHRLSEARIIQFDSEEGRFAILGLLVPGGAKLCAAGIRSEEHTSELQSQSNIACRLLLEKKMK